MARSGNTHKRLMREEWHFLVGGSRPPLGALSTSPSITAAGRWLETPLGEERLRGLRWCEPPDLHRKIGLQGLGFARGGGSAGSRSGCRSDAQLFLHTVFRAYPSFPDSLGGATPEYPHP